MTTFVHGTRFGKPIFLHIFYAGTKKIAIAIAFFTFSSVVLKGPTEIFSCSSLVMQSATLLKVTLLHDCFSRFLNCTNGTKSRNASHTSFVLSINLTWKVLLCHLL